MTFPERSATPLASSINRLRRQYGLGSTDSMSVIAERWPELAGEEVSNRSKVIDLRSGVLTVDAYDPGTAEVLKWSNQRILAGIRESCPTENIGQITVRVRRAEHRRSAEEQSF